MAKKYQFRPLPLQRREDIFLNIKDNKKNYTRSTISQQKCTTLSMLSIKNDIAKRFYCDRVIFE